MSDLNCKEDVWDSGGWRRHRCSRKAVVDGYCKQHHPSAVEKRRQARAAREEARWQASPVMRLERAKKRIAELKADKAKLRDVADAAREVSSGADRNTDSSGQVYVDEGSLQAMNRALAAIEGEI